MEEAKAATDRIDGLRKAKPPDPAALERAEAERKALFKAARDAKAKADAIENAVYDLKAVNPNRKATGDTRTPAGLLDLIEAKNREIAEVLALLRRPAAVVEKG